MPQKPKLTISEQIAYMRDHCGIAFSHCSEKEATVFLSQRNYFFKVKAFAKNYAKDANGKYIDLDFAYLQELSILDALLRKQILAIALDVEHFLKVGLMAEISQNDAEDGYTLVQHFFAKYPRIPQELQAKARNSYCNDLVTKMDMEGYAVWNAIEVLSFGQFIQLYKLCFPCAGTEKVQIPQNKTRKPCHPRFCGTALLIRPGVHLAFYQTAGLHRSDRPAGRALPAAFRLLPEERRHCLQL